ncbi:alpha/beta hydrolase [Phyllobacterium leguminum]|uniref:Alpha-beta hydrolase superfamily lysophospholipase n=1 Tax=Phyllobacterium leguminum TaxID=314237 RepID=A0A318SYW6_9HYPH|nr:alpha/beta hydrolase [Phyllobacterium leguminum]PYE86562.1 alpha-beta hydrolase superfamily lysophospholipase [Phyllobacterium leguminum]
MPFEEAETLLSPSGAALCLRQAEAHGAPRGVIHINHGLAEHSARYARFAENLAGAGFHVYAHDHRGHGETRAADAPQGTFSHRDGTEKVLADVAAVNAHIHAAHPGLPVMIFGHSMGGLITLAYVLEHPQAIDAAAIWNANFSAGAAGRLAQLILRAERMLMGSDVPSRALPKLTFRAWARQIPNRRTEFDWLSRDEAEVDAYIADPNCGWDASVGMWIDIFDLVFRGAADRNFAHVPRNLPFHLVGGETDPATDNGSAVTALARRMKAMGFGDVTERIYPETRHESLNEINREAITRDFIAWLDKVVEQSALR